MMSIKTKARIFYVFTDFFNGTLLTFLPFYIKTHFGFSGSEFGTILFIAGIFAILGILIGPYLINIFRKEKVVLIVEYSMMLLALFIIYFSNNFYLITLATGLAYLNRMAMYVIGDNLMSDIGDRIGVPFGKFRSFGSIGWALTFFINGYLIINHPNIFLIFWAILVVLAIINLLSIEEAKKEEKVYNLVQVETIKEISKYELARNYLFVAVIIYTLSQTVPNFINFLIIEVGGSVELYGVIFGALSIVEFIVMFNAHSIRNKLRDQQYIELIIVLYIVKLLLIVFTKNPIIIYISAIFDPFIYGLLLPFNPVFLKENTPPKLNGAILSLFGILSLLAIAGFSFIAGNLMDIFSTRAVFVAYIIVASLALLLVKFMKIDKKQKEIRRE